MSGKRSRGHDVGGWARIGAVLVASATMAAACVDPLGSAGGDDPEEPRIRSEPVDATDADAAADRPTSTPATDLTLTDRFQRIEDGRFGNESTEIAVLDGEVLDGDRWIVAGAVEDGTERTTTPVVATLPRRGGSGRPGGLIELPTSTGTQGSADAVAVIDGVTTVFGVVGDGDALTPVVWSSPADGDLGAWTEQELPMAGEVETLDPVAIVPGDPADAGYWLVANAEVTADARPLLWRMDGGQARSIPIEAVPGRPTFAAAGVPFDDGLVVVGLSRVPTEDPRIAVWSSGDGVDDELAILDTTGLPSTGSFYDIRIDDDGSLVAVGAETVNAVSTPLVARADGPDERWSVLNPTIDIAGWISFAGLELQELRIEDGAYHVTLTNQVVQQLSRSVDGGRTWERLGDLGAAGGNFVPANGFAVDGDEVLVTGGDLALGWDGASWSSLATDQDTFPTQRGAFDAFDVVAGADGFFVGGGKTTRAGSGYELEAVVWQSPDGISWGRPPLDGAATLYINDLFTAADGSVAAIKAGNTFFREAYVQRPGVDGRWAETRLPVGEAFFTNMLEGPAGAIIAAGQSPDEAGELIEPVFLVIDPDDSVRVVPLTNSPVEPGSNVEASCLAGTVGLMIAVLEWGDGAVGVVTSPNGERWRGLPTSGPIDDIDVSACEGDEDRGFVIVGRSSDGRPAVARSDDGSTWSVRTLDGIGAVFGVTRIGGVRYLTGWTQAEGATGSTATIWREDGTDWVALSDTGLEPDDFALDTQVWQLAESDGVVVAVGADRGRAGAWVASADVLQR